MKKCASVFVALVLGAVVHVRALEAWDHLDDAAQDRQGGIVAFERSEHSQVYAFDGKQWSASPAPILKFIYTLFYFFPVGWDDEALPARLEPLRDGTVACLWGLRNECMAITRHLGKQSELIAEFPAKLQQLGGNYPHLLNDSHGQLWLTGCGPEIHRLDRTGRVTLSYEIQPEQLVKTDKSGNSCDPVDLIFRSGRDGSVAHRQKKKEPPEPLQTPTDVKFFNPIYTTEDGHGRIWAWTNTQGGNQASLQGALIFDGDKVEHHAQFNGIHGIHFSALVKKDGRHMWIAVRNEGIFEVNIDTLEAKPVADPDPHFFHFQNVQMIFQRAGDWFVISEGLGLPHQGALWRLRDGTWTQLLAKLDEFYRDPEAMPNRAWLRTEKGLLLRAFSAAPWFISENAPPSRLDWQCGFTLDEARKIFRLDDGTFFALGGKGKFFHGAIALPPEPRSTTRVAELKIRRGWAIDAHGHIWSILADHEEALSEWNGERWLQHKIPADVQRQWIGNVAVDTRGRVWLLPDGNELVAACYDSRADQWQTFPKIEAAFETTKTEPAQFENEPPRFFAPQYNSDSQHLAFRSENWRLSYFDGAQWHRWSRKEITGERTAKFTFGQPFFKSDGGLCINIEKTTWQLDDTGAWQQAASEDRFPDDFSNFLHHKPRITPPEGCVTTKPDSIVADNQGVCWLTWQGQLYKCRDGDCVTILSKEEPNPFADRRQLNKAWVDRSGHVFLETAHDTQIIIAPKSPPPRASIVLTETSPDSREARLEADSRAKVRFRWQLDSEPWQPAKNNTVTLDALPSGAHTLTVFAIDEELQTSTPAVAKFDVKIDPQQQVSALIERLADPDFAQCESAVTGLARQPALALPALKTARENAEDDQRWWIDATIQKIERTLSFNKPK